MSWSDTPKLERVPTVQEPCVSFPPDWDPLFNNPSLNEAYNIFSPKPASSQSFKQPVQPWTCVPCSQPPEILQCGAPLTSSNLQYGEPIASSPRRCGEPVASSNFFPNPSSTEAWWLDPNIAPNNSLLVPENPLPQVAPQREEKDQTGNMTWLGEVQELKKAVHNLGDRCDALEDGIEESNRNLLQLRDCLNGYMAWTADFKNAADGFVDDTRDRVESMALERQDSKMASADSGP